VKQPVVEVEEQLQDAAPGSNGLFGRGISCDGFVESGLAGAELRPAGAGAQPLAKRVFLAPLSTDVARSITDPVRKGSRWSPGQGCLEERLGQKEVSVGQQREPGRGKDASTAQGGSEEVLGFTGRGGATVHHVSEQRGFVTGIGLGAGRKAAGEKSLSFSQGESVELVLCVDALDAGRVRALRRRKRAARVPQLVGEHDFGACAGGEERGASGRCGNDRQEAAQGGLAVSWRRRRESCELVEERVGSCSRLGIGGEPGEEALGVRGGKVGLTEGAAQGCSLDEGGGVGRGLESSGACWEVEG
jgi:hypothetical protein